MKSYHSETNYKDILNITLPENDQLEKRMQETYQILRRSGKSMVVKHRLIKIVKRTAIGMGSAAAAFLMMLILCTMNPVLAKEIPIIGSIFEKVADVFQFGALPKENATKLYQDGDNASEETLPPAETENLSEQNTESNVNTASPYQKSDHGLTVTLTEQYATNQAFYLGVCIKNKEPFPPIASLANGSQALEAYTMESYSFRPDSDPYCGDHYAYRTIEGRFEDAYTFIGIMRIDYSDINVSDLKYQKAYAQAQAAGEELWLTDENMDQYLDYYEIPPTFDMSLEFVNIMGYLAEPKVPEGAKSKEELAQMTEEEWKAYRDSLPAEVNRHPNIYSNWYQEGSWKYDITIKQQDDASRVITLNQVNELGVGMESIELSSVELTLHPIEPPELLTFAIVLDADGKKLDSGNGNAYVLSIAGHDISSLYIYLCDYDEYMDEIKGYAFSQDENAPSFQEVLEERALFKTLIDTKKE